MIIHTLFTPLSSSISSHSPYSSCYKEMGGKMLNLSLVMLILLVIFYPMVVYLFLPPNISKHLLDPSEREL